ncbi:MAG: hypothetical protein KC736_04355, partial [Candidatus Moranbacteria bacterium]|nr:hypothetical protein [Candidatus Moranbacteria bacterium]
MRYFFRSAKSFLGLLFVSAFFVPLVSFAESPSPSGSLQIVDCFDYYHFQSVQFGIGTDRGVYAPGDVVTFSGSVTNQNIHPIVDGYVFTRISRERTDYQTMGHDIVDEVFIAEDVALAPLGSSDVSFSWNVPENLPSGDYRADYFFSVGKKFNLSGLPFTNEIVGGSAFFSVENVSDENGSGAFVSFDRGATTVNSQKYAHIGDWVRVEDGASAVVSNTLVNESGASQT